VTNLILDNPDNYVQFSSHIILNSTVSNFAVEFFDNGDNRIDPEDKFIFYNYTEDAWIRITHSGRYIGTKIQIY
jgi:hypothetical protein